MHSLRTRLFAAILGAVLLAVGVSLALGIVLTRDASPRLDRREPQPGRRPARRQGAGVEELPRAAAGSGHGAARPGGPPFDLPAPPPGEGGPGDGLPPILPLEAARRVLPESAMTDLSEGDPASGEVTVGGEEQLFEARAVGDSVVIVARPDVAEGGFGDYLSGLLIASGLGAARGRGRGAHLAASRRPAGTSRGRESRARHRGSPEPVPRERTAELAALADAFNEMAEQLGRAREAERSVLLSVSHDLRTPLTAIEGYAEGIEDGTLDARSAAAVVSRESKRLERLVDDLLALAKLRQGVLEMRSEPVDVAAVLGEAEDRLRPQAEEAKVVLAIERGRDGSVTADHGRVLQVATNLIENAIRLTPEGGRVTATACDDGFTIADQGPGIPPEELAHAFERFHLRDRLGQGSASGAGLGLAIVRELTEAMGGSVAVESPPGEGARFTVRLPL